MPSTNKCPFCNSCLDIIMVMPRRYFRCWLEAKYFNLIDGKIVEVDIEKETGIPKAVLDEWYNKESSK
jgi:hypothetical protein